MPFVCWGQPCDNPTPSLSDECTRETNLCVSLRICTDNPTETSRTNVVGIMRSGCIENWGKCVIEINAPARTHNLAGWCMLYIFRMAQLLHIDRQIVSGLLNRPVDRYNRLTN